MSKRYMTVIVEFEDGGKTEPVDFSTRVLGGKVVGLASYDVMAAMEIAERAMDGSKDDSVIGASEEIDALIAGCPGLGEGGILLT